jgi:hypothetical protein
MLVRTAIHTPSFEVFRGLPKMRVSSVCSLCLSGFPPTIRLVITHATKNRNNLNAENDEKH